MGKDDVEQFMEDGAGEEELVIQLDEDSIDEVSAVVEVKIAGMQNSRENVFLYDLGVGEKIVEEMDVRVKLGDGYTCKTWLTILGTFGLYLIYLKCCFKCRQKRLWNEQSKLAVTDAGRILVWHSQVRGTEAGGALCCRGNRAFYSWSKVGAFSLENLSYIQHSYTRKQICCGCCDDENTAELLLFFGKYPNPYGVWANSNAPAFDYYVHMSEIRSSDRYSPMFSFIRDIVGLVYSAFGWLDTHVIAIQSPKKDCLNEDGRDFREIVRIESAIVTMKDPRDIIASSDHADEDKFWNIIDDSSGDKYHIVTQDMGINAKVNVSKADLGFIAGEEVVDVWPYYRQLTCWEILFSILTFCIYYCLVVTRRHASRSALILTTKRLFEVHLRSRTGASPRAGNEVSALNGSFEYVVNQWLLSDGPRASNPGEGYMERRLNSVTAHITTNYGGLKITTLMENEHCWDGFLYGISPSIVLRMEKFLMAFSSVPVNQGLGANPDYQYDENSWLVQHWRPAPGETVVYQLKSQPPKGCTIKPFFWGVCPAFMTRCVTCGTQPIYPEQEMLVSTHRIWTAAQSRNYPFCCASCLSPHEDAVHWKPLTTLRAWRQEAGFTMQETFWSRVCKCIPCCSDIEAWAEVDIGTLEKFPVGLRKDPLRSKQGLAEAEDLRHLRQVLASAVCYVNANVKGLVSAKAKARAIHNAEAKTSE